METSRRRRLGLRERCLPFLTGLRFGLGDTRPHRLRDIGRCRRMRAAHRINSDQTQKKQRPCPDLQKIHS
ncbi:hypothetical protein [Xanthomonas graminis]|uniref:hypothetical protein n=1 Tax=Xanthomonas graminis TaxID=3390026 RepID=UPI00128EFD15|nr:hypothetical protein [Xanthomonas translucens]WIH12786.1 hypothetical protein KM563_02910 [Xanthomonas translucens pv. graminis]